MKGKANVVCPKCKHCEGLDRLTKMYSCKRYNNYPESAIGMNCEIECDNFEEVNMNKVKGKTSDWCPKCKNCKGITRESNGVHVWLTGVECEYPYDGMVKTLHADSDICCSMFEPKKEKESFNLNMPSRIISKEEYDDLKKDHDSWRDRYYEIRYALRKDESLDESISCVRDIPSDVEMIEDLKKRAADSDYYKEKSELLEERNNNQFDIIREKDKKISEVEEKLKKANELAESWKRDYERIREQFLCPIYDILYPDNPNLDINVTDLLKYVKDLKVYADENGSMYKEVQEWREKYIARGNDIDHLSSENKELNSRVKYWSNLATKNAGQIIKFKQDRDEWRKLYNSLSETCADYDKRCKEECEKKYRDEISKLQNIVTEKEVEIKGLKKEIINLGFDRVTAKDIMKKNTKLNQTISDQEVTIKALLITIKEMCKED